MNLLLLPLLLYSIKYFLLCDKDKSIVKFSSLTPGIITYNVVNLVLGTGLSMLYFHQSSDCAYYVFIEEFSDDQTKERSGFNLIVSNGESCWESKAIIDCSTKHPSLSNLSDKDFLLEIKTSLMNESETNKYDVQFRTIQSDLYVKVFEIVNENVKQLLTAEEIHLETAYLQKFLCKVFKSGRSLHEEMKRISAEEKKQRHYVDILSEDAKKLVICRNKIEDEILLKIQTRMVKYEVLIQELRNRLGESDILSGSESDTSVEVEDRGAIKTSSPRKKRARRASNSDNQMGNGNSKVSSPRSTVYKMFVPKFKDIRTVQEDLIDTENVYVQKTRDEVQYHVSEDIENLKKTDIEQKSSVQNSQETASFKKPTVAPTFTSKTTLNDNTVTNQDIERTTVVEKKSDMMNVNNRINESSILEYSSQISGRLRRLQTSDDEDEDDLLAQI